MSRYANTIAALWLSLGVWMPPRCECGAGMKHYVIPAMSTRK